MAHSLPVSHLLVNHLRGAHTWSLVCPIAVAFERAQHGLDMSRFSSGSIVVALSLWACGGIAQDTVHTRGGDGDGDSTRPGDGDGPRPGDGDNVPRGSGGLQGVGGSPGAGGTVPGDGDGDMRPIIPATPRLHVEGRYLKDPAGNTVILRGVALADPSDVNLRGGLSAIDVIDRVSDPNDDFYARVVRLTVFPDFWLPDPGGYFENHLLPAVEHATERGLYVIIDWHEISDVGPVADRVALFWQWMAPIFAGYQNVLYEIFNEPINQDDPSWSTWKREAQPWVDIIRAVAPETVVLVGGPFWSQMIGGAVMEPFEGGNIVYVGHIYPIIDPYAWSYAGPMATVATAHPVFITEWGFRDDGDPIWDGTASSFGWPLRDFIESNGMSWTAWCADNLWGPMMFDPNWNLLVGEGEMGGFAKDWLFERRNDDQPNPFSR